MRSVLIFAASTIALAAPASAQSVAAPAQASTNSSFTVTTGVDHSSGKYGLDQNTNITVVPIVGRLTTGDFEFVASMPYIWLNSPGGVVIGPDGHPIPGVPTSGGKVNGFGDVTLGAKYDVPNAGDFDINVGGGVKLPTANKNKGLSTGKADFNVGGEVGYTFGNVSPFIDVGYRWFGDPDGVDLRNGPTASVGTSVSFGKSVLIASYDYARAASATAKDSHELFAGLAVPAGERLTVTGYGTKGLSQGSPDYGVGLLLSVKGLLTVLRDHWAAVPAFCRGRRAQGRDLDGFQSPSTWRQIHLSRSSRKAPETDISLVSALGGKLPLARFGFS